MFSRNIKKNKKWKGNYFFKDVHTEKNRKAVFLLKVLIKVDS